MKYRWLNQSQVALWGGAAKPPPKGREQALWKFTMTHPDHDTQADLCLTIIQKIFTKMSELKLQYGIFLILHGIKKTWMCFSPFPHCL